MSVFLAAVLLISACSNGENTNQVSNQSSNQLPETNRNSIIAAKNDPAELGKIINLPIMPLEAEFREEPFDKQTNTNGAAPVNQKMTAVLLYDLADTPKLIALIEKHKPGEAVELEVETWFPAELIAQSQTSGNDTIKGNAYAANDFLQTPYSKGRIIHISGTDYFVLELSAM